MNVIVRSRIVGTFLGYSPGVVHRLDDGSEWVQVGNVEEYVYRRDRGAGSSETGNVTGSTWKEPAASPRCAVSWETLGGNWGVLRPKR